MLAEHRCSRGRAATRFSRKKALKGRRSNLNMILKVSVERVSLARTKLGTEIRKVIYTDLCVHVSNQDTDKYFQIEFLHILNVEFNSDTCITESIVNKTNGQQDRLQAKNPSKWSSQHTGFTIRIAQNRQTQIYVTRALPYSSPLQKHKTVLPSPLRPPNSQCNSTNGSRMN